MLLAQNRPGEGAAELEKVRTPEDDQTPLYLYALATARVREGKLGAALEAAEEARALAEKYALDRPDPGHRPGSGETQGES